jgi:RNA polymerase sigma factor (sigma-70 family)
MAHVPVARLFHPGTVAGLSDSQLLERFVRHRRLGDDEAAAGAFEAIVTRHGPLVHRVCRGLLRDPDDVDDAFQATFLVLVRKAKTLNHRDRLAPWLHGVAHRVALKARTERARRSNREAASALRDEAVLPPDFSILDHRPALLEELGRLPENYRAPLVLCHLDGRTHAEAADELGWPVGTVSVRIARARKLLHDRLTRRGVSLGAPLWALVVEGSKPSLTLIQTTTQAALQFARGGRLAAAASLGAADLARRTLMMMLISLSQIAGLSLALLMGTVGAAVLAQGTGEPDGKPVPAQKPAKPPIPFTIDPGPHASVAPRPPGDETLIPKMGVDYTDAKSYPASFFDLETPLNKGEGDSPTEAPRIRVGQILVIEVLEALPGRPITGERVVASDGTVNLGFYGNLHLAGLNRTQAKVKVIEHLLHAIEPVPLGLLVAHSDNKLRLSPPAKSNRVFVDDSVDYHLQRAKQGGDVSGKGESDDLRDRIDELDAKLDRVLRELKELRRDREIKPDAR